MCGQVVSGADVAALRVLRHGRRQPARIGPRSRQSILRLVYPEDWLPFPQRSPWIHESPPVGGLGILDGTDDSGTPDGAGRDPQPEVFSDVKYERHPRANDPTHRHLVYEHGPNHSHETLPNPLKQLHHGPMRCHILDILEEWKSTGLFFSLYSPCFADSSVSGSRRMGLPARSGRCLMVGGSGRDLA